VIVSSSHIQDILNISKGRTYAGGREACGFILDVGSVVEVCNMARGNTHFVMEPEGQLKFWDVAEVIWHTHPGTLAIPSPADRQMYEIVYSGKAMLIVAVQTGQWTLTYD
jgi:proteasome lid subunit RPN8/RPN11